MTRRGFQSFPQELLIWREAPPFSPVAGVRGWWGGLRHNGGRVALGQRGGVASSRGIGLKTGGGGGGGGVFRSGAFETDCFFWGLSSGEARFGRSGNLGVSLGGMGAGPNDAAGAREGGRSAPNISTGLRTFSLTRVTGTTTRRRRMQMESRARDSKIDRPDRRWLKGDNIGLSLMHVQGAVKLASQGERFDRAPLATYG